MRSRLSLALVVVSLALAALAPSGHAGGRATTKWPNSRKYTDAMVNPGRHLVDPKLRGATVEVDKRGRPVKYSGNFSTAFPVTTTSGRKIAVRVFHPLEAAAERHDVAAFGQRYSKLNRYLSSLRRKKRYPPEIVEFAFVDGGIRVDGDTLPIMKMPWVEGRNLDDWMERRLGQGRAAAVGALAKNWRAAIRDLRSVDIAHGDLHHGNVKLEPNGTMRFVDYDGMYAPPLAGLENSEIGHPNFQHPSFHFPAPRTRPFDREMDNFSSIVIYLSLRAVAADPALWGRYHNDHNLIFDGERDFLDPNNSPVFKDLAASKDPEVKKLARLLARYARGKPEDVPSLEKAIAAAATAYYKKTAAP